MIVFGDHFTMFVLCLVILTLTKRIAPNLDRRLSRRHRRW